MSSGEPEDLYSQQFAGILMTCRPPGAPEPSGATGDGWHQGELRAWVHGSLLWKSPGVLDLYGTQNKQLGAVRAGRLRVSQEPGFLSHLWPRHLAWWWGGPVPGFELVVSGSLHSPHTLSMSLYAPEGQVLEKRGGGCESLFPILLNVSFLISIRYPGAAIPHLHSLAPVKVIVHIDISGGRMGT